MNYLLIFFLFIISFVNSEENYVRISIVPEYEQNLVTVLISVNQIDKEKGEFSFSLPNNTDSSYVIKKNDDGGLSFNSINYFIDNNIKWLNIPFYQNESAFMILTNKYQDMYKRTFNYQLSFTKNISQLDIEIQEPLMAKDFLYSGFSGAISIDSHGQKTHRESIFDLAENEIMDISFEYFNDNGTTTKLELNKILKLNNENKKNNNLNFKNDKKKVKRYKLYILETLIALFLIIIFVTIILHRNYYNIIICNKCGYNIKMKDLFCSKCGEKR